MWLVLSAASDAAARWACQGLKARGLEPLEWISQEALAEASRWEHRLGAQGTGLAIGLADGRCIRDSALRGVLNRLTSVPEAMLVDAHAQDRDYAAQEMSAFFLSWLHGLPGSVLNRASPAGLGGAWRHASQWFWLATQAGLPAPPYRQASQGDAAYHVEWDSRRSRPAEDTTTVFVVHGRVVATSVPESVQRGCQRLAELSATELLGIDLAISPTGLWTFAGASPCPDLRRGGEALLDTLAEALAGRQGAQR
jgi:hypothetical protein